MPPAGVTYTREIKLKQRFNMKRVIRLSGLLLATVLLHASCSVVPVTGRKQLTAPGFLSTHPNPENRIARLNQIMPKALEYYNSGK